MRAENRVSALPERLLFYDTTSASLPDLPQSTVIPGRANGSRECAPDGEPGMTGAKKGPLARASFTNIAVAQPWWRWW
jgi:hypothetical protein